MSWSDTLLQSMIPEKYKNEIKDYDDLTDIEKDTYKKSLELVQSSALSLDDLKQYIISMRQSVEMELAKLPEGDPRNVFLKARLMNYILFETSFFGRPDKAKEMLQFLLKRGSV